MPSTSISLVTSALALLAVSSSASASLVQAGRGQASVNALVAAGYYDTTGGTPYICEPLPNCASLGCMSFGYTSGNTPLKGFYQFRLDSPSLNNWTGLYSLLTFDYGSSGATQQGVINSVNAQAGQTGVYATTPQNAGHADSHFTDWLPANLQTPNNVVFNWYVDPVTIPTTGLSDVFTFAWDFTGYPASLMTGGFQVTGVGGVPAPGALALLTLAGVGRSRRRGR
jgi:hypothetical protein